MGRANSQSSDAFAPALTAALTYLWPAANMAVLSPFDLPAKTFSEVISTRYVSVFEVSEYEGGFCYVADLGRWGRDALQDAPSLGQ